MFSYNMKYSHTEQKRLTLDPPVGLSVRRRSAATSPNGVHRSADLHCCVILAASALMRDMSSRFMRNTKRRLAIWRDIFIISFELIRTVQCWVNVFHTPLPPSCYLASTCCPTGPVCRRCRWAVCLRWRWRSLRYSSALWFLETQWVAEFKEMLMLK